MPAATLAPTSRAPRTRRANRTVLALLGVLMLAAGAAGLVAGLGAAGERLRDEPVLTDVVRDWVGRNDWFWVVVAACCLLVALLALRWLYAQVATNRVSHLELESDRRKGRTTMAARAVTDAVAGEIDSYRGVSSASAQLIGDRTAPKLLVRATLDGRGDPADIRARIQTDALAHARQALEKPNLPVRLELRLAGASRRDLR